MPRAAAIALTPLAPANFDRLARVYEALERLAFGSALQRRRSCFLRQVAQTQPRRALVLGDGDGRFSAALLEQLPALELTAVDSSRAMLRALEQRVRQQLPSAALDLHCADCRAWCPEGAPFDLVATHFFFDCFSSADATAIVAGLAPFLAPSATWLCSDFALPEHPAWRLCARGLIRALYFGQRLFTGSRITRLADHATALRSAGFELTASKTSWRGMLRSELWKKPSLSRGISASL